MIFSQFRDSVEEIVLNLEELRPLVKPAAFVGQASNRTKGLNQRKQLEMIEEFKKGYINTLVCTSIGEEGLDIGEVDLIICFDTQQSPTRTLQRVGRTGRKRKVFLCPLCPFFPSSSPLLSFHYCVGKGCSFGN